MDTGNQPPHGPPILPNASLPPAQDPTPMEVEHEEDAISTKEGNPAGLIKKLVSMEEEAEEEYEDAEEDEMEEEEAEEEAEEEDEEEKVQADEGSAEDEEEDAGDGIAEEQQCSEGLNNMKLAGFANGGFDNLDLAAKNKDGRGEKKASDPRPNSTGLYLVCQVTRDCVIGIRKSIPRGWPFFLEIDDQLVKDGRLQVGDTAEVVSFSWIDRFRYLAAKKSDVRPNRLHWLNASTGQLPRQAEAKKIESVNLRSGLCQPFVGVVYFVKRRINTDKSTFIFGEVACCGLAVSSRFNTRQLDGICPSNIDVGMLVTVMCLPLRSDDLVEPRYLMPAQSPFRSGLEVLAAESGALVTVRPFEVSMPDPIFPYSAEFTQMQLECAEHVAAASIQFSIERVRAKLMDARFEGSATVEGGLFLLTFPPKSRNAVIALCEAWEVENLVKATRELGLKHFAQGEVVEIASEELDNGMIVFSAMIKLTEVQRKKTDGKTEFDRFKDGVPCVIFPVPSAGAEERLRCFKRHEPSTLAREDTPRGRIMAALLNRPTEQQWKMPTEEELNNAADEPVLPDFDRLNARQRITAQRVMEGQGILVSQQAPPGTGKTEVAVTLIKPLLEQSPDEQVTVLACSNLPIAKLVAETQRVSGEIFLDSIHAVAMFSASARVRYAKQIEAVVNQTLQIKFSSEEYFNKLDDEQKKKVEQYIECCAHRPKFAREREIGLLFQQVAHSKLLFCSASLAEDTLTGPITQTKTLIFDESTQASWPIIVHLVAKMPRLRALLLTGDKRQLGTYLRELPELFQAGFGLESVTEQIERSPAANYTFLTQMYRSHPFLVSCLSYASYERHDEQLIPCCPAEERALVTGSSFSLPQQDCPIVLINAYGDTRRETCSESLTDDHQTAVVFSLVKTLLAKGFTKEQVVVLCMYSFQADQLEERLSEDGIHIVTVDAYQAQEMDIVILVTTRSRASRRDGFGWQMDFFRDDRRATVALSRARHALFLIGDLVAIAEGPVWRRFIERALTRTRPVVADYAFDLLDQHVQRLPYGALVGRTGPLEHQTFMDDWHHYHGPAQAQQRAQPTRLQLLPDEWPALPGRAGPARRRDENEGRDGRGRGHGRVGPRGRWLNYGGNPRRQRGLH